MSAGVLAVVLFLVAVALASGQAATAAVATPVNGQITFDRTVQLTGKQSVLVANPNGKRVRIVVRGTCCAGFSPDGSKLVVPDAINGGRIGTAILNADGTGYTKFPVSDPTLNVGCGAWSPDGTRLACETWDDSDPARNGIYTISALDGSGLTRVTSNPLGGHDLPGSYSPNGKSIVFIRDDASGNPAGMFVVNLSDGQLRQIVRASVRLNLGADWSPQGNEIIFSRHVGAAVFGSIWMIRANGRRLHEIHIRGLGCGVSVGCHGVGWSPDGKKIIFVGGSPARGTNIYTANANGTGLTQVTFDGNDDDPAWGTHPLAGP
jgi:Tol biopolymer transport system component